MRLFKFMTIFGLAASFAFIAPLAHCAAVTGTVKGPDGTPFKGAFVEAQNKKTRITVNVLSDKDGRYHVDNLPAGDYTLRIRAIGYAADPRDGVTLSASQKDSFDWALKAGIVRWSDLSFYEGDHLLPDGPGKKLIEERCLECHAFQTKMAGVKRDQEGWNQAVNFMRTAMHYRLTNVTDEDGTVIATYLNSVFGTDSKLPRNAAEMPDYKKYVHGPFADDAMKIVYVSYEMPGPNRMPFSAAPDKNGNLWIPYWSLASSIARLDPKTGEIQEFRVPAQGTVEIHSAVPAPDGSVYLEEQATNRVGRWDPKTQQITEFQDSYLPGKEGLQAGGSKHTARVDSHGNVWSSGGPLTELDPKTGTFKHFNETSPYGIAIAKDDTLWFAEFNAKGKIGKVDPETGKVTKYTVPTANAYPRRIQIAPDGAVWFAEFGISSSASADYVEGESLKGKVARFDPKTETFKEYQLPGRSPSPYAFGMDAKGNLWYSNMHEDLVGCLDPNTGKTVEYPLPFSENTMREFFLDDQGRVWWASPSNNNVGYFYLASN
jgi:virginiamycin B lyase